MTKVGFIGAGNMGFAIMKGIIGSNIADDVKIYAFDTDLSKADRLKELGIEFLPDAESVAKECKYVFLAIKPQVKETVLENIKSAVSEDTVIVSILAGVTAEYIQAKTIPNAKVVLVMPNTPLLLGEGASALSKAESVSDEEFDFVMSIFASCGKAKAVDRSKMKEIIAINGSSPAFIYLFAKGFIDYAAKESIDPDIAKELFAQTLIGSAKMITDSGYTIDELIKMVSSPGGTTLAGLDKFYQGKLTDVVDEACSACTNRAYELAE